MQLLVPLIAWGFVSGGQFAITQIMQSATGGMDAGATRMAVEAADGNLSMGNQNLMNETIASRSIAQQNNVGSHNYAETLNTGSQVITQGENGQTTVQENQDTLRENYSSSGQLSSSIGNSVRDSKALTEQQQNTFNDNISDTSGELLSFTKKVANGTIVDETASESERAAMQQTAEETLRQSSDRAKRHGVSAETGVEAALRGSLGTGAIGRLAGIELNTSGAVTSGAKNTETMDKVSSTAEGKALTANLTKITDFASNKSGKITDSSGRDAAETLNHSLNTTQSSGEAYSRSAVTTKNWEKTQAINAQNTVGTNTNENAPWLEFLGEKTGLSRPDLISKINQGGSEVEGYKSEFLASKQQAIRSSVENGDHLFTDKEVQGYLSQTPQINSTGREHVQNAIDGSGFKTHQQLTGQVDAYKHDSHDQFKKHDGEIGDRKQSMGESYKGNEGKFEYENSRTNMARSDEKIVNDVTTSAVGLYEDAKSFVGVNTEMPENPLEGASNAWKTNPKQSVPQQQTDVKSDAQKDFEAMNKGGK